jgi:hypothetical protein
VLEDRLERARADWEAGTVHVVRGGKHLARTRHHLSDAQLTETDWRRRWEASRWFLQADGESGKRYGNETIRISPEGEVSIKLPAPLAQLANAPDGRYMLVAQVRFPHRGQEWADRVAANRAVAYRIHLDVARGRWYVTACWQLPVSSNAHGLWIGIGLGAQGVPSRVIDFWSSSRPTLHRRPGRHDRAERSECRWNN